MACGGSTAKMSPGREQCRLLLRLLWMDDHLEQAKATCAQFPKSLPRKPCLSPCRRKPIISGHPALEVHVLGPSDLDYKWTTGVKSPCNFLVTGKKIDMKPTAGRRGSSATGCGSPATVRMSSAVKQKKGDATACAKRSAARWSSRMCDAEREERLLKLLNEFGEIRERSRQAQEMLRESFKARRKSLKTQWCNREDIANLGDDLNWEENGKPCNSVLDVTLPELNECSNCGCSH